ncbi:MAG TPA: hypothetical protein VF487_04710 [Chitinophagaceae bacterium]
MRISLYSLNRKHHKLLSLISNHVVEFESTRKGIIVVPFEEIYKVLKCNRQELNFISSRLFEEKECDLYDVAGIKGLFCTPKGTTSFINRKYPKENKAIVITSIKDYLIISIGLITIGSAIFTALKAITVEQSNKRSIEQPLVE